MYKVAGQNQYLLDVEAIGSDDAPGSYSNYNAIPWRLAMITQANSTC